MTPEGGSELSPSGPGKSGPVSMKSLRAARRCPACVDSAGAPDTRTGKPAHGSRYQDPKVGCDSANGHRQQVLEGEGCVATVAKFDGSNPLPTVFDVADRQE
jgi:hypothetical protein